MMTCRDSIERLVAAPDGRSARHRLAVAFKAAVFEKTEWRPVSNEPAPGHITLVSGEGRTAAGIFKDAGWTNGKGKPLPFVPTHWLAWLDG